MLNWPLHTLAVRSRLSLSTLRRLEEDGALISERSRMKATDALREGGIRFVQINDRVVGIVLIDDAVAACTVP